VAVRGADVRPYAFLWANAKSMELLVQWAISHIFLCIFRNPLTLIDAGPLGPGPRIQELGTLLGHHGRDGSTCGMLGIVVIISTVRLQI